MEDPTSPSLPVSSALNEMPSSLSESSDRKTSTLVKPDIADNPTVNPSSTNDFKNDNANNSHVNEDNGLRDPLVPCWTRLTIALHQCLANGVTACALAAARHPKTWIGVITVLAITLQVVGYFTNFRLELDLDTCFTPVGSQPQRHAHWIFSPDGFPDQTRSIQLVFHADGANVLHVAQARRVLEMVNLMRETPNYKAMCARGVYVNFEEEPDCRLVGVSGFWDHHNVSDFDATVQNSDDQLRQIVSGRYMADGTPVFHDLIIGNSQRNASSSNSTLSRGVLTSAESYLVQVDLPETTDTNAFEADMLRRLDHIRRQWMQDDTGKAHDDPTRLTVDIMSVYGYQLEIIRSMVGDLYLIAICIAFMVGFTCLVFYRHHSRVESRTLLGLASVFTVFLSYCTGNGLMFLIGVPFSAVHQMLPFVVFGIGLDDTFIIMGAYLRFHRIIDIEERVRQTMQEIGPSILLTTITTVFAFALGYFSSSFPGVHWLCIYAVTIISCDFFYQITFFIAFLVLDERRIQANRKDCCFWITATQEDDKEGDNKIEIGGQEEKEQGGDSDQDDNVLLVEPGELMKESLDTDSVEDNNKTTTNHDSDDCVTDATQKTTQEQRHQQETVSAAPQISQPASIVGFQERIMIRYSDFLLRPWVKIAVLVLFTGFFALCCYSASLLEQQFNVSDYVSDDSYLSNVFFSLDQYSSVVRPMGIYFRYVDQTDPDVQRQMIDYVNELERLDQIGGPANISISDAATADEVRPFCWVRDFPEIQKQYDDPVVQAVLNNMTFIDKLDFVLSNKVIREVYGQDIVRDEAGNITASRCFLFLKHLDLGSVQAQVDLLLDQRQVTMVQPINQAPDHQADWPFFSWEFFYFFWEAYAVAVKELMSTMIVGVVAVTAISFVFIPHWSAVCFVVPLITILYIDLLGTVRFLGLDVNGLMYICVVVAIGLLVDFLLHVLLRYYESSPHKSRDERVKETLRTMGVSILVGGSTTVLGVVPLCLSSAKVFETVFYSFSAMVVLGCAHGLIVLPVLLSYLGPNTAVRGHHLVQSTYLLEEATISPAESDYRVNKKEEEFKTVKTAETQEMDNTIEEGLSPLKEMNTEDEVQI